MHKPKGIVFANMISPLRWAVRRRRGSGFFFFGLPWLLYEEGRDYYLH